MNNSRNILITVIIILVVALIAGMAFLMSENDAMPETNGVTVSTSTDIVATSTDNTGTVSTSTPTGTSTKPSTNPGTNSGSNNTQNGTTISTTNWTSYSFKNVGFKYPAGWTIIPHYGTTTTSGSTRVVIDVTIVPPAKTNDNDVIVVGGTNLRCANLSTSYMCREVYGVPFYTRSGNASIKANLSALITTIVAM